LGALQKLLTDWALAVVPGLTIPKAIMSRTALIGLDFIGVSKLIAERED
jgi:hypothetical protein